MSESKQDVCQEKVYSKLFSAHAKDLHNFLYYKYGDAFNPGDVVQEAFVKLWNNCASVPFEKAKSFLFTVAKNFILNEIDKSKTAQKFSAIKPKSYTHENPEYLLEEQEYQNKLESAINELTEEMRVTFLLNRIEGKKHQEIADMLGISRKAVEKRIYKALALIREKVEGI
ncbi:sigma-70 family RNA polymerase sigma factor [Marivirga arenosa]|uniref:Sigma-70 family RNA polymerase sigma factor n=1 Tax=Marivirga arenosa TaxID=3059076 RepID=A0AA49JA26_9BACT|nr:sigma-70 family RNA polymerase sigma factor [Marivirga sp. ABR2-2]WKK84332.1 sigma-70 family RNA polymerase sigma factor [Marivirga sp. ABR2-2]